METYIVLNWGFDSFGDYGSDIEGVAPSLEEAKEIALKKGLDTYTIEKWCKDRGEKVYSSEDE